MNSSEIIKYSDSLKDIQKSFEEEDKISDKIWKGYGESTNYKDRDTLDFIEAELSQSNYQNYEKRLKTNRDTYIRHLSKLLEVYKNTTDNIQIDNLYEFEDGKYNKKEIDFEYFSNEKPENLFSNDVNTKINNPFA